MFELIRANKRNSIILMLLMAVVLLLLGYIIGIVAVGPDGGFTGLIIATAIWLLLTLISFSSGDQILLASSKAVPVTHEDHPQLFNVVEEMAISAGLPVPKVYIIPDHSPNAFATGRTPDSASVAVTAGLLGRLNRDELQGVIGHEMSHILHRDILFVTLAGIMLGSIVLLSEVFMRSMYYGSMGSRRRYSAGSRGSGQAQIIMFLIAILAAILAPIMAQLLYFALSQRREYLADAGSARLTRYPEGLASALEKIASDPSPDLAGANKVTAPMYIINPFKKGLNLSEWTSTHPPIAERVRILRGMTGASFRDYSEAYKSITGKRTIVPSLALTKEDVELRRASAETRQQELKSKTHHNIGDIIRQVNGFLFLTCVCGLKMKIPPNFKDSQIVCPKCNNLIDLPRK